MVTEALTQAAALLAGARRVAVLTGAGVSAESGVPTFRGSGGLWEGSPVEEVASPEGFFADPLRILDIDCRRDFAVKIGKGDDEFGHVIAAGYH